MTKVAGAALAVVLAFASGEAKADFINAVGYVSTVIYNGQTLNVSGPVSVTIDYLPNFVYPGVGISNFANIQFSSGGVHYNFNVGDDGYGRETLSEHEIDAVTTYFTPFSEEETSIDVTDPSVTFESDKPYRLTSGFDASVFSYDVTYIYDPDTQTTSYFTNFDMAFTPYAIGINVSAVPLPASAPLFGAALLALGGASYAHRRMRAKAA